MRFFWPCFLLDALICPVVEAQRRRPLKNLPGTTFCRWGTGLESFSGLRTEFEMMPHEEQINESGNISLPLIGSIKSAGKTLGQLQMDIQNAYVPKYYKNLNISVTAERFYFVGGEVRSPNRYPYLSGVTVLQAIQSASDFTDFADRKHVQLKRANGKIEIVNCKKALNDPKLDLPVYPSDTITVPRGL